MRQDVVDESDLAGVAGWRFPKRLSTGHGERKRPVLKEAAFHGVAGRFTKIIEPQSEADPTAILVQFLVALGTYFGRDAGYYQVEATKHYPNLLLYSWV